MAVGEMTKSAHQGSIDQFFRQVLLSSQAQTFTFLIIQIWPSSDQALNSGRATKC